MAESRTQIQKAYNKLLHDGTYKHSKLLSALNMGTWKYMFANVQYRASGKCLLKVFPNKPKSSADFNCNNTYIFNELDKVNTLRNRIAHHEPICFTHFSQTVDTSYIINEYQKIQTLFAWMGIDSHALLYGLDHVQEVCNKINKIKQPFLNPRHHHRLLSYTLKLQIYETTILYITCLFGIDCMSKEYDIVFQ